MQGWLLLKIPRRKILRNSRHKSRLKLTRRPPLLRLPQIEEALKEEEEKEREHDWREVSTSLHYVWDKRDSSTRIYSR